ncbi:uncharacterized protein LOC126896950 isoform X2 [Daktulosphaira vitifoliae]|uniref:uncharacterized protein LOC126896950 isoform X2 n=1 Tax=Daktulosphaira vitifoliae TaxID=58002 RepID=UPI0021A9BE89|nr:uncharacterized protein LOC126896950 isoform X2 [Daktulosphaira vitifoliae]
MGFYFYSGIFLFFMCVITLPIFSTGIPCSVKETSNNESNQNDGPEKVSDTSDSSDENDGPSESIVRDILNVSNEILTFQNYG